ncbi:MAG: hypothetical protein ACLFPA_11755 [Dichotomicrobium sp.]
METGAAAESFIAWQGWGMTGAAVALLILLIWILVWLLPFPSRPLEERLADPESRAQLRDRLGGAGAFGRYRLAIRDLNAWLDAWFGPSTSGQALERCIAIAFVYPAVLFVATLVVAGAARGQIAPHEIGIFLVMTALAGYLAHRVFRALYRVGTNFWRFVGGDSDLIRLIARVVLGALAVILAFAIAFVIASTVAGAFAEAGTIVLAILAAFALAFALAGVLAAAGTAAAMAVLLGLTVAALAFSGKFAFLLLLFFVLLPIFNALLDWMSWIVTRFFLRRVARVSASLRGAGLLVLELSADLVAAVILFLALVVLLPNGIELINAVLSLTGRAAFDWRDVVLRANDAPLSEGLFVIGMLVTTLVPTFIHFTRGLAGIAAAWTPGAAEAAAGLREATDNPGHGWTADETPQFATAEGYYHQGGFQEAAVLDYAVSRNEAAAPELRPSVQQKAAQVLRLSRLWYIPAAALAFGLFVGLVALVQAAGVSPGDFLVRLAFCGSSWSHGECPA